MRSDSARELVEAGAEALRAQLRRVGEELDEVHDDEREGQMQEWNSTLRTNTAATVVRLAEAGRQREAELLLTPLLDVPSAREPEPITTALAVLEEIESRELSVAVVRWLVGAPTSELLAQLPKLDPGVLGDRVEGGLGQILERLWTETQTPEVAEAHRALAVLGDLRGDGVEMNVKRLAEAVEDSLAPLIETPPELEQHEALLGGLEELVEVGLLERTTAADIALRDARGTAVEGAPLGVEAEAVALLASEVEGAADHGSPEELEQLETALEGSSWVNGHVPLAPTIRLRIAAALGRKESPIDVDGEAGIEPLAREHGTDFAEGVAIWLVSFDPAPRSARSVLAPYLDGSLPRALREAVPSYADRLGPEGRLELLEPTLEDALDKKPDAKLLRALRIQTAEEAPICERLLGLYEDADRMDEREEVLVIWRALEPAGENCRRALIRGVFIPLASLGIGGYELARKYLDLCQDPPTGTKEDLMAALSEPPDQKRGARMAKRMDELQMRPRKKSLMERLLGG